MSWARSVAVSHDVGDDGRSLYIQGPAHIARQLTPPVGAESGGQRRGSRAVERGSIWSVEPEGMPGYLEGTMKCPGIGQADSADSGQGATDGNEEAVASHAARS
jgi:hypothetical protein